MSPRKKSSPKPAKSRGGPFLLRLLFIVIVLGLLLAFLPAPWAVDIGGHFSAMGEWDGYGPVQASNGGSYILFSQMRNFRLALVFIALSRMAVGVSSVLNMSQLLRHVADAYRGRVFSTIESMQWSVMMVSMMLAGIASQHWDPRTIGAIAGALSSTTAIFWGWAHVTGRLPEPACEGVDPEEIEVHGEPTI